MDDISQRISNRIDRISDISKAGDKTVLAVQKQLEALGCKQYEVGIRNNKTGQMMLRTWTPDEVMKSVNWLKRQNALGNDIYIRPHTAGDKYTDGARLIDDLKPEAIDRMKKDGLEPSLVVETSPGNYQAWVRTTDKNVSMPEALETGKHLAKTYGGDLNSVDGRHFGRLAGFTNRKPEHMTRNIKKVAQSPFVRLREAIFRVASKGKELTEKMSKYVHDRAVQREKDRRINHIQNGRNKFGLYQERARELIKKYGNGIDYSRMDYMIAKDLAKRYDKETIIREIAEHSPNLADRKAGHVADYLNRTVDKAIQEITKDGFSRDNGFDFTR